PDMTALAEGTARRSPAGTTARQGGGGDRSVAAAFTRTPYYVLTGGLAVLFLFPLVWATVASVSPQPNTNQRVGWGFGNYVELAGYQAGLGTYLTNSLVVSSLTVVFTLVVSLLGGYAFARFRFPGRNVLFMVTLAILMVPY